MGAAGLPPTNHILARLPGDTAGVAVQGFPRRHAVSAPTQCVAPRSSFPLRIDALQTLPAKGIAGCRVFAGSSPDWPRSGRISTPRGAEPRVRTERIAPLSIRWRLGTSGSVAALQSCLCNALTLKARDTGPPGGAADTRRARSISTRCCCRPGRGPRRTNSPGAGTRCKRICNATSRGAPAPDIRVRSGARVKTRASA